MVNTTGTDQVDIVAVKAFARITDEDENALIERLIKNARMTIERLARITIVEATRVASFSMPTYRGTEVYDPDRVQRRINMPYDPINSITSIVINGPADDAVAVSSDLYKLDTVTWDIVFYDPLTPSSYKGTRLDVTYVAGYDNADANPSTNPLPVDLYEAIVTLAVYWYDERDNAMSVPDTVMSVIKRYWSSIA